MSNWAKANIANRMGLESPVIGTDMSVRIVNDVSASRKFQTKASTPDLLFN